MVVAGASACARRRNRHGSARGWRSHGSGRGGRRVVLGLRFCGLLQIQQQLLVLDFAGGHHAFRFVFEALHVGLEVAVKPFAFLQVAQDFVKLTARAVDALQRLLARQCAGVRRLRARHGFVFQVDALQQRRLLGHVALDGVQVRLQTAAGVGAHGVFVGQAGFGQLLREGRDLGALLQRHDEVVPLLEQRRQLQQATLQALAFGGGDARPAAAGRDGGVEFVAAFGQRLQVRAVGLNLSPHRRVAVPRHAQHFHVLGKVLVDGSPHFFRRFAGPRRTVVGAALLVPLRFFSERFPHAVQGRSHLLRGFGVFLHVQLQGMQAALHLHVGHLGPRRLWQARHGVAGVHGARQVPLRQLRFGIVGGFHAAFAVFRHDFGELLRKRGGGRRNFLRQQRRKHVRFRVLFLQVGYGQRFGHEVPRHLGHGPRRRDGVHEHAVVFFDGFHPPSRHGAVQRLRRRVTQRRLGRHGHGGAGGLFRQPQQRDFRAVPDRRHLRLRQHRLGVLPVRARGERQALKLQRRRPRVCPAGFPLLRRRQRVPRAGKQLRRFLGDFGEGAGLHAAGRRPFVKTRLGLCLHEQDVHVQAADLQIQRQWVAHAVHQVVLDEQKHARRELEGFGGFLDAVARRPVNVGAALAFQGRKVEHDARAGGRREANKTNTQN